MEDEPIDLLISIVQKIQRSREEDGKLKLGDDQIPFGLFVMVLFHVRLHLSYSMKTEI